jgi:hypothetical protein
LENGKSGESGEWPLGKTRGKRVTSGELERKRRAFTTEIAEVRGAEVTEALGRRKSKLENRNSTEKKEFTTEVIEIRAE